MRASITVRGVLRCGHDTAAGRMTLSRSGAGSLDRDDPLAHFRDRFLPQTDDVVAYLDGNSLGRPLASIADVWADFAKRQWAGRLIRGWTDGWLELPEAVGDELAAAALGAAERPDPHRGLHDGQLLQGDAGGVEPAPRASAVVVDRDHFPTNRYVVESLARDLGLRIVWISGSQPGGGVGVADVLAAIDDDTAVVTLSHIAYRSGYLADAGAITSAVHRAGALVVWDLCHSVGVVPVSLDDWQVDFAVGCTYKFVGAGPGAPAFVYVNAAHHAVVDQPIWGWLGRRRTRSRWSRGTCRRTAFAR